MMVKVNSTAYSEAELQKLIVACGPLPSNTVWEEERRIAEVPVLTLMSTVLSLRRKWDPYALNARKYFEEKFCTPSPPSLVEFVALVFRISHSETNWEAAALALWNKKEWVKAKALFKLAKYFLSWQAENFPGASEYETLKHWADTIPMNDFLGKIKHLGPRAHEQLLWYIEGEQAVKLDVHVVNFVQKATGRRLSDSDMINAVRIAAGALGMSPTKLDARIW